MPDPTTDGSVDSQRPSLKIDGAAMPSLDARVLRLEVLEDVHGSARLTADLVNLGDTGQGTGYLHFDSDELAFGRDIAQKESIETVADDSLVDTDRFGELGSWFDGAYDLVALRHVFEGETGFRTHFTASRPAVSDIATTATQPSVGRGRVGRLRPHTGIPGPVIDTGGRRDTD